MEREYLQEKLQVLADELEFRDRELAALRSMLEPWGIRMTGLDDPLRFWEVLFSHGHRY